MLIVAGILFIILYILGGIYCSPTLYSGTIDFKQDNTKVVCEEKYSKSEGTYFECHKD